MKKNVGFTLLNILLLAFPALTMSLLLSAKNFECTFQDMKPVDYLLTAWIPLLLSTLVTYWAIPISNKYWRLYREEEHFPPYRFKGLVLLFYGGVFLIIRMYVYQTPYCRLEIDNGNFASLFTVVMVMIGIRFYRAIHAKKNIE